MAENWLARLFEHNLWANERIIQACSALSDEQLDAIPQLPTKGSIRQTLIHLVTAQRNYLALLTLPVDERPSAPIPFDDLSSEALASGEALLSLVINELSNPPAARLQTTDGYITVPWVVILQIINHASEHREQISSMLSNLGVEPPDLDGWAYAFVRNALVPIPSG